MDSVRLGRRRFASKWKPALATLGVAPFVVDRYGGLVGVGALDVVDGNVIAEDRPRIRVRLLDGSADKSDEAHVWQPGSYPKRLKWCSRSKNR